MLVCPPVLAHRTIAPQAFARHFREKFRFPMRKALFFVRHEGLRATWRKYRSKKLEKYLEEQQVIVLGLLGLHDRRFVGVTRYLGTPFVFDTDLIFELPPEITLADLVLSDEMVHAFEAYLPVHSCPLALELASKLQLSNPFLRVVEDCTLFQPYVDDAEPLSRGIRQTETEGVYLLGLGAYAREYILPAFRGQVIGAADYKAGLMGFRSAEPFLVCRESTQLRPLLAADTKPLVIICTYHSDHATKAFEALEVNSGAFVFVEKPVCVTRVDAERLFQLKLQGAWIDVGFNRRYAPFTARLQQELQCLPRPWLLTMLIKELRLPLSHWYFWPNQGTRITGNLCHWIDLAFYLVGARPTELTLLSSGDDVSVGILFADGTLVNIVASDMGADLQGVEEYIEVRAGDCTIAIHDFERLVIRSGGRTTALRSWQRDKGHAAMYQDLRRRWQERAPPRYQLEDLFWVSYITHELSAMLSTGQRTIKIESGIRVPSYEGASTECGI
jgi:predicted dehydrogenase